MTEEEVYRQVLKTLTPETWGQGSWVWPDVTPKCLDGHINHAIYDKCQIDGMDIAEDIEKSELVSAIHRRIVETVGVTVVIFNDSIARSVADVRLLVYRLLDQVAPPPPPVETVLIEEPRRWWQRRRHSAHRFNLLR